MWPLIKSLLVPGLEDRWRGKSRESYEPSKRKQIAGSQGPEKNSKTKACKLTFGSATNNRKPNSGS
jgi:hypothetical protein